MSNTVSAEGQGVPFDIVIWTRDYKEKPRQFERLVDQWVADIQDSDCGAVLIRDTPFCLGPEALPRNLLVSTCFWSCSVVFIVVGNPLLPVIELAEIDAELAYGDAQALVDRPGVKHLILVVAPQDAERWHALAEYHNPGAWICRIDADGSRIVKVGAGDVFPLPVRS